MFKNFLNVIELAQSNNILIPENFNWARNITKMMPNISLDIPEVCKRSKVYFVQDKKNPITIYFTDGSKIFCTYDQYLRFPKKLNCGDELEIKYQGVTSQKTPLIINSIKYISV